YAFGSAPVRSWRSDSNRAFRTMRSCCRKIFLRERGEAWLGRGWGWGWQVHGGIEPARMAVRRQRSTITLKSRRAHEEADQQTWPAAGTRKGSGRRTYRLQGA